MVAGQGVLVRVLALVQLLLAEQVVGHHGGDDPGHVDVGQARRKVVQVDVQPVAADASAYDLTLDPVIARPV